MPPSDASGEDIAKVLAAVLPSDWDTFLEQVNQLPLEKQRMICGGTCAFLPIKIAQTFDFSVVGPSHYQSIMKRYSVVTGPLFDEHPFNPDNPGSPVRKFDFTYDYGPPSLRNDVLWMLDNNKAALKDGAVVSVEPIVGERTAVMITLQEGRKSRVKISDLIEELPDPVKYAIQTAMTDMPPHGEHQVQIEISTDPIDIMSKSTNQYWTSCETLGGGYSRGVNTDLEQFNAVAIVRSAPLGRPLPKRWTARVMLRWCERDENETALDIGMEPRFYGGNAQLNRFVQEKLETILSDRNFGDYGVCVTPYEYKGFSDQAASTGCETNGKIAYGPNAQEYCEEGKEDDEDEGPTQDDYDSLIEEYDHYGVCVLEHDVDFNQLYFAGTLSDLLRDATDYDPRDGFEAATDCHILTEQFTQTDWARYKRWDELIDDLLDYGTELLWDGAAPSMYYTHRYVLTRLGLKKNLQVIPVSHAYDNQKLERYNTLSYDSSTIDLLYDAFKGLENCFDDIFDQHQRKEISDDMYDYEAEQCTLSWRNKFLNEADIHPIEIPLDFDEATAMLEKLDLDAFCTAFEREYDMAWMYRKEPALMPHMNIPFMYDNDSMSAAEQMHFMGAFDNLATLHRSFPVRTQDVVRPCGALVPILHRCKLPIYAYEPALGFYTHTPFEQWSKDPKYHCSVKEPGTPSQ